MRIVCPNCDTAYNAPESAISLGRLMRCAKCRNEWMPVPPEEPAPAGEPDTAPAPESEGAPVTALAEPTPDILPEPMIGSRLSPEPSLQPEPVIRAPFPEMAAPEPPRRAVIAGWVASVLVLVAALWLAIAFREPVMRHWPASARAYAALGYR
jgi:predicted Zn finger-like uncharacterized protein